MTYNELVEALYDLQKFCNDQIETYASTYEKTSHPFYAGYIAGYTSAEHRVRCILHNVEKERERNG
jgi:hypothetical protein